jgi:hypothetical protein
MILSRPPVSVSTDAQKSPNKAVMAEKATTSMVRERDDQTRHPVTKKFTSRWQNEQSSTFADEDTKVSQDKGSLPKNGY